MTLLAGVWRRDRRAPRFDSEIDDILSALETAKGDGIWQWRDATFFAASASVGPVREQATYVDEDGAVSLLAGDPLLASQRHGGGGNALAVLHSAWLESDWAVADDANGVFSGVHFDPRTGRLALISDVLAIRPLYYLATPERVFFSSALSVFEGTRWCEKVMDLRGVTELASIGYPLGSRSPYQGLERNRAGETIIFTENSTKRIDLGLQYENTQDPWRVEAIADAFQGAIDSRIEKNQVSLAFLSGGMDSRAIVSSIRERGEDVHTFNFSAPGTQDHSFSGEFARLAGTVHHHLPWERGSFAWAMASALRSPTFPTHLLAEEPYHAWSGDGGSVGLGWVLITPSIVEALRTNRALDSLKNLITTNYCDARVVLTRRLRMLDAIDPLGGMLEELEASETSDPVRSMYKFLLNNDQRRHLARHFEEILGHRLEFHLPFFDRRLLSVAASANPDEMVFHRGYSAWWDSKLPSVVRTVPWQTYPGHVRCPIAVEHDLEYQWSSEKKRPPPIEKARADRMKSVHNLLFSSGFPSGILSYSRVLAAYMATQSGLRDYHYLLEAALVFHRYALRTDGRYSVES